MPVAIVAGLVLYESFPPRAWWWAAPIAVALAHIALQRTRPVGAYVIATSWGLAFFLPLLWWSTISVGSYLPWIALSLMQSLFLGLYGALRAVVVGRHSPERISGWRDAWGSALLFVTIEALRSRAPFGGFAWGLLGYSQVDSPLLRLAPYGSSTLVGAAVVFTGVLLARVVDPPGDRPGRFLARTLYLLGACATVLSAVVVPLPRMTTVGSLNIGAVQGNVPRPPLADFGSQARQVTANHRDITLQMVKQTPSLDLVIWPESSADLDPRSDELVAAMVLDATRAAGVPVMVGTQQFGERTRTNEHVVFVESGGELQQIGAYVKQHPVPFGEYIPLRSVLEKITSDVNKVGTDMVPGDKPAVIDIPLKSGGVRVGDVICFEISVEDIVRQAVRLGAQILVVPTNNASFGDSQEAAQQLMIARFRAAEHGRSLVQVSTVGMSAFIDARGRVIDHTQLWTQDYLAGSLPLYSSMTPADRIGPLPIALAAAGALGWLVVTSKGARRARRRRHSHV